jgi:hydroxymethylbilane synthase
MPMEKLIRIGTRESQLAVWQAEQVRSLLAESGFDSTLIYIRSQGDIDQKTPLYALGVQGIFTRALDTALLNDKIDIAVHSMKDLPVQLAKGIIQFAVLKRGPSSDLLVFKDEQSAQLLEIPSQGQAPPFTVATGSIRRRAQWLNKYPEHLMEDLRGNIDTRLVKLKSGDWNAAIFALAGLERIGLRPNHSKVLDWMLPAPAQGAIMVVGKEDDIYSFEACQPFHDADTALCTKIERDFLSKLQGGCSTPIGALAELENDEIFFRGNMLTLDGKKKCAIEKILPVELASYLGIEAGEDLLNQGGLEIADQILHG